MAHLRSLRDGPVWNDCSRPLFAALSQPRCDALDRVKDCAVGHTLVIRSTTGTGPFGWQAPGGLTEEAGIEIVLFPRVQYEIE